MFDICNLRSVRWVERAQAVVINKLESLGTYLAILRLSTFQLLENLHLKRHQRITTHQTLPQMYSKKYNRISL